MPSTVGMTSCEKYTLLLSS